MSEREQLQAILTERGVAFRRNQSLDRLRALVEETAGRADNDDAEPEPAEERIEVPPSPEPPVETGKWPRQVAPCVWLDRAGRRWTDLGEAISRDEELR